MPAESNAQRKARKRAEALAEIRRQVKDGTLKVRKATPAEREAWRHERADRIRDARLRVSPPRSNKAGGGSRSAGSVLESGLPDER